jgi:hypothetical protein
MYAVLQSRSQDTLLYSAHTAPASLVILTTNFITVKKAEANS